MSNFKVIFKNNILKLFLNKSGLKKYQRIYEILFRLAIQGMNIGGGSDVYNSGESFAINYIKDKVHNNKEIIIFDVGANVGNWSQLVLKDFKEIDHQLFCFEPAKESFYQLKKNLDHHLNIKFYNFAFGAKNEAKSLFYDKETSGLASIYNRQLAHFNIKLNLSQSIKVRTLDNFCEVNKIKKIDFLKIDVEGSELNVLKGAKKMIEDNKIQFIQFEFGGSNIDSRTYFQDFYYFLKDKYYIYRILKDGFYKILNYKEYYELFLTTNFLAEHK